MDSAFNPEKGDWELAWPARISQHDLVYLSPPHDPMQGIPLGNGDMGALLWCEPSRIVIAINKCDLWDDADFGRFHNWSSAEEDKSTALRHGGRLIVDFGMPLMDPFYLKDFEARLELASAQARVFASTPFGRLHLSAYVSADENALIIECETDIEEKCPHEVILERWGSRTFAHWYAKVRRDPEIGLSGTDAAVSGGVMKLTHRLTSGEFAVGCKIIAEDAAKVTSKRLHSRAGACTIESDSPEKKWSLYLTVTSPQVKGSAAKAADEILGGVIKRGKEELFKSHQDFWKRFWHKSYINIPEDYLENLWHLTMYYAGSSQRGPYPATFVNGLWGWNRDVHPWNFYFHWNQQILYWPLHAAGHHELLLPYLNYRFNSLPHAMEDARDWHGSAGAFISDVAERRGYNDEHTKDNHTPVAQIAMDFWRYYRYTGDREFLRGKALPFMEKAAEFFETLFEKRDDGLYHAKRGTVYEGGILCEDSVTELSTGKALFNGVLQAAKEAGTDLGKKGLKWKEIAENLAPLIRVNAPEEVISESDGRLKLNVGPFRGSEVPCRELIAGGKRLSDGKIMTSRIYRAEFDPSRMVEEKEVIIQQRDWGRVIPLILTPLAATLRYPFMPCSGDVFPGAEFCPVFPAEIGGLAHKDTDLFKSFVSTAKAYSPDYIGWEPLVIILARLGLADEAMTLLGERPDKWQMYCNGFWRANSEEVSKMEGLFYFGVNRVAAAELPESDVDGYPFVERDKDDEARFDCAAWPYRHMESEPMGVLACAINEMLMQSHDGIIRIAPAFKWDAEFSLHAVGGFVVSSELKDGSPAWVALRSLLGNRCSIENPWQGQDVYIVSGDSVTKSAGEETISFDTVEGGRYILSTDRDILKRWNVLPKTFEKNTAPKKSSVGIAKLGLPRMF